MKWKKFIVTVDFEVEEDCDVCAERVVQLAISDIVEYSFFIRGYKIQSVREKKEDKRR
ncbi:hypothetical protein J7M02_06840 [Candidatus Aerophobetes bacterium]|nr:hypothetical protein [Candidatus Aerophobetes bacterium]